jgi:predicted metal-dependent phosphoesterase TrpH
MSTRLLFHLHTKYSFDSLLSPQTVVNYAAKNGYAMLAITDHDTIRGAQQAKEYSAARYKNLEVIIGAEYATDQGDLIGLFLREEVRARTAKEFIKAVREQGGLVVLPHPYKSHPPDEELVRNIDIVEVYNSRLSQAQNDRAAELAAKYGKPALVGSDAHFYRELGLATVRFTSTFKESRDTLLRGAREFETSPSKKYFEVLSQLIKAVKLRHLGLIKTLVKRIFKRALPRRASRHGK